MRDYTSDECSLLLSPSPISRALLNAKSNAFLYNSLILFIRKVCQTIKSLHTCVTLLDLGFVLSFRSPVEDRET